jgi:glycosyltransferase involved in cell wall biosynthesis
MTARIAVLVPCRDEAVTIAKVVADFRAALPAAAIHVLDNASGDGSAALAAQAGARVHHVERPGKAQVMRRGFADIDADVYVMVDGDDTYDPGTAAELVRLVLEEGVDMAVGRRVPTDASAWRPGHQTGNRLLRGGLSLLFGRDSGDLFSGYRALSRRCVKSFPVLSSGFAIETELTVHALELAMPVAERETAYRPRPAGSVSKLATVGDGARVLRTMLGLFVAERPLAVYGTTAALLAVAAVVLAAPLLPTYLETGLVPRLPTAILATGLALVAALALTASLVLDTVTRGRREQKLLAYLGIPGPRR